MYRSFGIIVLLSLGLATIGCGTSNNSNSSNINGAWTANLTNTDNSPAFAFTTNFTQESGNSISVTNFKFTTTSSCFSGDTTQTGSFGLSGNFNGNVAGTFGMNISTTFSSGTNNQLALNGAVSGNTITGNGRLPA
ncbi:MAG: hypothetical protein WA653_13650 [Candidatus Sulfotelmatobacter sp.]